MHRLIWLPVIALAACGTDDDQRPRTVEYITEAILAPNCGNAQCHSSFRNAEAYAFDTVERARPSLAGLVGVITIDATGEAMGDPDETQAGTLMNVLTRRIKRMPYDQGLPEPDIDLIRRWIAYGAPGAQCIPPAENGGPVCVGKDVVQCSADYSFDGIMQVCPTSCSNGVCR